MVRAVYQAASAMLSQIIGQDVHTNNLANVNTIGFKRALASAAEGLGAETPTDSSPGDLRTTDAPLDLALHGDGYFVCAGQTGRYCTRNGSFTLNARGVLVNSRGHAVLGERGPITVGSGNVRITEDGGVYVDGALRDRLLVVSATPGGNIGDSEMIAPTGTAPATDVTVVQGALENSNVNAARELAAMRNGYRLYEANANVIRTTDRTLSTLMDASTG